MTAREVILAILKEKGMTQSDLAKMVGLRNQSNVSETLKREIKVSVFVRFLNALGYRVVIEKKSRGRLEDGVIVLTEPEQQNG